MSRNIDNADIKLIRMLAMDGRISISKLAEATGLSYTAIRNRILRLMNKGYLEIKPYVSSKILGSVAAIIKFKTRKPEKLAEILSRCNKSLGVMVNHDGVIAMIYSKDKVEIASFIGRLTDLDLDIEEYHIEYGKIPYNAMIPIRNPYPDCSSCLFYQLELCSGCLPLLRIKGNNKSNNKRNKSSNQSD